MKPDAWHDPLFLAALAANGKGGTASGSIVTFRGYGNPLRSLRLDIDPVQDLHGYANPWPAGGGKNKFDIASKIPGYISVNGEVIADNASYHSVLIPVNEGTTYTFSGISGVVSVVTNKRMHGYNANGDWVKQLNYTQVPPNTVAPFSVTATIPTNEDIAYIAISFFGEDKNIQVETGSTVTTYAPYSNICPITGWTGASVFRAGRNMFDEATAVLYDRFINVAASPTLWSYDASSKSIAFPCKPNTTYSVSCSDPDAETVITVFRVGWIESGIPSGIGTAPEVHGVFDVGAAGSVTLTTGEYAAHIVVQLNAAILSARSARLQIEPGSATPYEAYRGAACVFDWESEAGTVYGGTLDVTTGVLTADRGLKVFTGQEQGWEKFSNDNPNGTYFGLAGTTAYAAFADDPEAICSINKRSSAANFASGDGFYWTSGGWRILYGAAHAGESLDDFKTYVQQKYAAGTPVAVCAKLASPITYHISTITVQTLDGQNTMWGDSGDISVEWGNGGRISKGIMLAAIMNDRR